MTRARVLVAVAAIVALSVTAAAWHGPGHHKATTIAVQAVADHLPAFFVAGVATVAHCSADPDTFRRPLAAQQLHDAEAPEHYFDTELLEGAPIPAGRYAFIALCAKKSLDPSKVGLLPYAVTEWTLRLAVALAEHRKWPANPHIRAKCLVYAGLLSHYAQDLCMPLHTTIHYDGRAQAGAASPRTGIHVKVDALPGKLKAAAGDIAADIKAKPYDALAPAVIAELRRSHALVDEVYQLEGKLPALKEAIAPGGEVEQFATARLRAAAAFTARLYATAWHDSKAIKLPDWHKRETPKASPAASRPAK